jgi:hypothetical protein
MLSPGAFSIPVPFIKYLSLFFTTDRDRESDVGLKVEHFTIYCNANEFYPNDSPFSGV